MKTVILLSAGAAALVLAVGASAITIGSDWSDNFQSYPAPSTLVSNGSWSEYCDANNLTACAVGTSGVTDTSWEVLKTCGVCGLYRYVNPPQAPYGHFFKSAAWVKDSGFSTPDGFDLSVDIKGQLNPHHSTSVTCTDKNGHAGTYCCDDGSGNYCGDFFNAGLVSNYVDTGGNANKAFAQCKIELTDDLTASSNKYGFISIGDDENGNYHSLFGTNANPDGFYRVKQSDSVHFAIGTTYHLRFWRANASSAFNCSVSSGGTVL